MKGYNCVSSLKCHNYVTFHFYQITLLWYIQTLPICDIHWYHFMWHFQVLLCDIFSRFDEHVTFKISPAGPHWCHSMWHFHILLCDIFSRFDEHVTFQFNPRTSLAWPISVCLLPFFKSISVICRWVVF